MGRKLFFLVMLIMTFVSGITVSGCYNLNPENIIENRSTDTSKDKADQWEYMSINSIVFGRISNNGVNALMERANDLGKEGWELVSSSKADTGFSDRNLIILFFKRKLPQD